MTQDLKQQLLAHVTPDLARIEAALADNLTPRVDLVRDIAGHLLFSGGKRIRPLLMILSARMCGLEGERAVTVSTIFEYLHAATLLHDDVVDDAVLRRGKPAAHTRWKNPEVVLTGDFLLARSLSIAAETGLPAIIQVMAGITEEMSQGEIDQLAQKGNLNLTEERYMTVIRRKTAVLLQGACRCGALLAGADTDREAALDHYGYHLGIAFQMADDLLDYTAEADTLGKNPGADIREGKLTLPLIKALATADDTDREWMENIIRSRDIRSDDFSTLTDTLHRLGGIAYTREKAAFHVKQALQRLDGFPDSPARQTLSMIARYAIARDV